MSYLRKQLKLKFVQYCPGYVSIIYVLAFARLQSLACALYPGYLPSATSEYVSDWNKVRGILCVAWTKAKQYLIITWH